MQARGLLGAAGMRGGMIQSEALVRALCRVGFIIYRRSEQATILERGARAVVVPTRDELEEHVVADLRKMAGLPWRELDSLLADPDIDQRRSTAT